MLSLLAALLLSTPFGCATSHGAPGASSTLPVEPANTVAAAGMEQQFDRVARQVSPSVVAISSVGANATSTSSTILHASNAPQLAAALDRVSRTVGTGFVIDSDGYILTDQHVIDGAVQLWVTTDDQKVYPAMVVGSDPRSDLAVLKIPASGLKAVRFANPQALHRGQWSLTMGNPYGLATAGEMALSVGVVSAVNRSLPRLSAQENRLYYNLIQTTAEINPGNSGGPLFDLQGQVIGINAAVVLPQKNTNGIGFAFAVTDDLLNRIAHLKAGEPVVHAHIGVNVSSANAAPIGGAHIDAVSFDSPANAAGLKPDDIVTRINASAIVDAQEFVRIVNSLPIDKPAAIEFLRDGKLHQLKVTPAPLPAASAVCRTNQTLYWAGMLISPVDNGQGYTVRSIAGTSPFVGRGIKPGSIITGVGGKAAKSILELMTLLSGENDTAPYSLDIAAGNVLPMQAKAVLK